MLDLTASFRLAMATMPAVQSAAVDSSLAVDILAATKQSSHLPVSEPRVGSDKSEVSFLEL